MIIEGQKKGEFLTNDGMRHNQKWDRHSLKNQSFQVKNQTYQVVYGHETDISYLGL
jgi:hypothetical protein